ncbi:hypothetical protein IMSHALPRED_001706 [Imshaugia aleurites]|uniref:Uncharacterized protein n=1 Tax=Imshaugia aleurites TaxID=172621 RepID=A0A8H3PFA6_9LECA|nr:hypothetical protein IMSHALPRED_001706 [Imshaugia aleurites]
MASQTHTGMDRSAVALGLGFSGWTRNDLNLVLNNYGVYPGTGDSKNSMMTMLNQLAVQRGLTHVDRLTIVEAHKAGLRLPPRKAILQASSNSPNIHQTIANPPTIAQSEEYSSGINDDSDVDMSDNELAEELPSLSEKERDLREYTTTMSLPRTRAERRNFGPRSAATLLVNKSKRANRPVARIHSAVRNRRTSLNRPVTRSRPAEHNHCPKKNFEQRSSLGPNSC